MGNRNLKLLDLIDKEENIYDVIMEIAKRCHELMAGAVPKIEVKKDENLIQIAIEEYIQKIKSKKGIKNE
ncbi:MAG: DNA-directed RNA polymerase subunit omega [Candidatus Omnitrophica bacterium]|nr:DNA-directed RNA polymerase subunit omega [Candidatus Omnitrophota bacterium]MCM8807245.1 DNA-directed RNA polymerase subunit omega [Candidatus Omnitrophota bacterium]